MDEALAQKARASGGVARGRTAARRYRSTLRGHAGYNSNRIHDNLRMTGESASRTMFFRRAISGGLPTSAVSRPKPPLLVGAQILPIFRANF